MSPTPASPNFGAYLAEKYPIVKAHHPDEGRRKWRLRAARDFWKLSKSEKGRIISSGVEIDEDSAPFIVDDDPLDGLVGDEAPGLGIILRTDFANEDAWQHFVAKLQEGEAEFASEAPTEDGAEEDVMDEDPPSPDQEPVSSNPQAIESDEEQDEGGARTAIFQVINPDADSPLRHALIDTSNLSALRMVNDVTIRSAPTLPPDAKRHKPPNRLVDQDGWQEVYEGKMVWVYDKKSNVDSCVRVVSQAGGPYGTATADSWRARVSHICELQVNLAMGMISIDFGGLDRYDYEERTKNLREAEQDFL